jgi:enoyl-CoA hydratase
MSNPVTVDIRGGIATLTMDDGKANALALTRGVNSGLDLAAEEAKVVVIKGRPGILSAGFDLRVIRGDDAAAKQEMRDAGFALMQRLYMSPQPIIMACEGHAGGAVLLLTADERIGIQGDHKLGLNEVAIGMPLPVAIIELARDRLTPEALSEAILSSRIYSPEEAVRVGFLDQAVAPQDLDAAVAARAASLLETDLAAFAETKRRMRQPILDRMSAASPLGRAFAAE